MGLFYLNDLELAWLLDRAAPLRGQRHGAHTEQPAADEPLPSQPCHDDSLFGLPTLVLSSILGRTSGKGNANYFPGTRYGNQPCLHHRAGVQLLDIINISCEIAALPLNP